MEKRIFTFGSLVGFLAAGLLGLIGPAIAADAGIETQAEQAIVLDMTTGTVLLEKNADERMPTSSMSKMITVYKVFERLRDGRLSLEDTFHVSEKAWRKQGSKMFVGVNTRVSVQDLLRGIIVQSGNDATIVVAEGLAGSESAFADELNRTAEEIGMTDSNFVNASGWPDPDHYSTARDLAKLAEATIRHFPEYYHYYSEKTFTYNGIKQSNRNPLLYADVGADGLKTGHAEEAGYGLTASAERNGRRLIMVLNGLPDKASRGTESERLLDWAFREFDNYALFNAGEQVSEAEVWMGVEGHVPLMIEEDVLLTLPRKSRRNMKAKVLYAGPIAAPIAKGRRLATLRIEVPDREHMDFPLVAGADVPQLGIFSRLGAAITFVLWGESS